MNRVIKNYVYNLSYQILLMILPIITTPYVSRVLHADGVGKYNYAFSIISVTLIVAQLGTNMYGQREIAYVQESKKERSKVFWDIIAIRLITTLIVCPLYICIALYMSEYTSILLAMCIYLFANILDFSWYFQGLEEFKKTALRSMASKILGAVLVFCFVRTKDDIFLYAVILATAQLVGNIVLIPYLFKSVYRLNIIELSIKRHVWSVLELFLPTAAIYVYTYIDKIILGALSTDIEVGYYSQTEKIIKLLMTIVTSLGIVLLPHIATFVKEGKLDKIRSEITKAISFVVMLGLPMIMGCIFIGSRFIPWFLGEGFEPSVFLFKLLSPLILIIGLASIVGQAILIPLKKQKTYTISIFAGVGINLIMNFVLIPRYGAVGASVGTIFAELTVTSLQLYYGCKYINLDIRHIISNIWRYMLITAVIGFLGIVMDKFFPKGFVYMSIIGIVSCILYFLLLIVSKDELLILLLKTRKDVK